MIEARDDSIFEAMTPLGFAVCLMRSRWNIIARVKHPVMAGKEDMVRLTLVEPVEIRRSRQDARVYLFYRPERADRWICAVAKRLDGEGFLITAYPTDAMKEGEKAWTR